MIKEITDSNTWNDFVLSLSPNTFLQSWEWGETQQSTGEAIYRLGVFSGDKQIGAAQVVVVNARRGRHYLIPHGPLFVDEQKYRDGLAEIIGYLQEKAKKDRICALRVAPLALTTQDNCNLFKSLGFIPAPLHVHAELTWALDISPSLSEVLASMRKTTRHSIKKSEQAGVIAEVCTSSEMIDRFMPLYETTRQRHGFVPFSRNFIQKQVESFRKNNRVFAVFGKYQGEDVAAGIFVQFGSTVFYHHGASKHIQNNVPVAHAVQWVAIQEAKKRGATRYNFWGIAPKDQPKHPFAGITVFKQGFGGYALDYLHAQDLPLSFLYSKLWLVESIRKIRRGF